MPAGRKHGFRNTGTGTLHVQATLAAPIFEASFDDQKEVSRRWVPGTVGWVDPGAGRGMTQRKPQSRTSVGSSLRLTQPTSYERAEFCSARSTRSGVIGMRVRRTPIARAMALATAAAGGTIGTSPTPRTP